ncbi:MAG TPA: tetratricopeptide repeat protein [Isosphaeraceae bacterium]|nr:tetratricopeptide repeat protein [Isosphaeraceae bacterium]
MSGGPRDAASAVYVWKIPEAGPEEFVGELKGYEGKVTTAGFSPDGQLFAVVSQLKNKGKVSLWRSGGWDAPIELAVPDGIGQLGQLAFCPTPSSNRLAVAVAPVLPSSGNDRLICLEWSLNEFRVEAPLRRHTSLEPFPLASLQGEIQTFVTYKPDGSVLLVSNSLQNSPWAYVWLFNSKKDPTTESPTRSFQFLSPAGPVLHAAFSRWDDRLVIASADGNAVLWSSQSTGQGEKRYYQINSFKHKSQISKADFSPDERYIVTASRDYRALVWDADSGELAHPSFHHGGSVTDAGFTDDGRSLITSSRDTIYRWDLTRGESRPLPLGTRRGVRTTSADPEGNLLVTAGERLTRREQLGSAGWARVWDAVTGDPRSPELQHPAPVLHAAISGSGRGLVSTITSDGEVRLWEASSGRQLWSEKPKEGMAVYTAFGCAEGGVHLLALFRSDPRSLSSDSYLRIYPLNSKGEQTDGVQTFKYAAPFTAAAFSPKCKHVIAYTGDGADNRGEAVVWEIRSETQKVLQGSGKMGTAHDEAITHAAFTSDGDYLVTTGRDDKAFVWGLRDGSYRELLTKQDEEETGHTADIEFASFDRAGTRVVTAGADGWAIVWEWAPDQQQFRLVQKLKNNRALTHAVFSTDERYVLTADTDGTTRLWDIKDRRPLVTKYHPGQIILQLVFREDEDEHARVYLIGNQARRGPAYSNRPGQMPNFSVANPSVGPAWPVVTEWRLTSATPPGDDDQRLAQWTASRQLIDTTSRTELTSLAQDAIFKLWRDTSARPNLRGPSSSDEVGKWHEREAALCELDGRWSPAIEHWTRALENTSVKRRPILLARRARAYSELQEWEHAELDLTDALSEISRDSELWQARADARFQRSRQEKDQNKLKQAINDYQQALQANQDNGLARAQLAAAFVESGHFKEALAEYNQAVDRDKKNPDLLLGRAQALMKSGDRRFDRAYKDFLTAGQLFKDRGRFDQAVGAYSAAVVLFKYGVGSSRQLQAKVHAELAEVQRTRADVALEITQKRNIYEDARKHFLDATNLDDTVWTYWSGLARCHERLEEWKEARQAFEKALKLNPGDPTLTVSWAGSLVQLKDWDEAAKAHLAIIQREPKVLSHRLRLAAIYLQPIPPEKEVRPERLEAARLCLAEAAKGEYLSQQSILWLRLAVVQLAAGKIDDYQATRARMFEAFKTPLGNDANNVAWAAAFAKDTPEGAERAIKLAVKAVSVSPQQFNYLNTYGALLYRGDKREDAIKKLEEATKQRALAYLPLDQLAYGNALDKLFIAMAQYSPEQPEQARQTLKLAVQTINRVKPAQQYENPEESLARVWDRLEFEVLRREAESLINR